MRKDSNIIQSSMQKRGPMSCDTFHGTIEFIGKRWVGIIVYRLLDGPKRYHELLVSIHGISDRLLTERLRELEQHGLVTKHVAQPPSRKVEYSLTDVGKELKDVIEAILLWVDKYSSQKYKDTE